MEAAPRSWPPQYCWRWFRQRGDCFPVRAWRQARPAISPGPGGRRWRSGLLALLCMSVEGAVTDWSALLLTEHTGASDAFAAIGFAAFSIAMAACRFAGDALILRFGARRVMAAGGLCIASGLVVAAVMPYPLAAATGFALVGLGAANVVPVIFGAAARVPGISAGAGVATAATIGYSGFLLGPPLIGAIASAIGLATALGLLSLTGICIALGARIVNGKTPSGDG